MKSFICFAVYHSPLLAHRNAFMITRSFMFFSSLTIFGHPIFLSCCIVSRFCLCCRGLGGIGLHSNFDDDILDNCTGFCL